MSELSALDPAEVDPERLERDPAYRLAFLSAYIGLTEADRALIRASRPHLLPWMPRLMAALEQRLLGFSNTRRHFTRGGEPGAGPTMVTVHLRAYVDTLLRTREEAELGAWLARVAAAHGPEAGDPGVVVPLVEIDALLGFIADQIIGAVGQMELPEPRRIAAIRAWSKLLWIQADLFHHAAARQNTK